VPRSLLEAEFGVPADVFSVTSFSELRREALDAERWNLLQSRARARAKAVHARLLAGQSGPFVAATATCAPVPGPDPANGCPALPRCS